MISKQHSIRLDKKLAKFIQGELMELFLTKKLLYYHVAHIWETLFSLFSAPKVRRPMIRFSNSHLSHLSVKAQNEKKLFLAQSWDKWKLKSDTNMQIWVFSVCSWKINLGRISKILHRDRRRYIVQADESRYVGHLKSALDRFRTQSSGISQ